MKNINIKNINEVTAFKAMNIGAKIGVGVAVGAVACIATLKSCFTFYDACYDAGVKLAKQYQDYVSKKEEEDPGTPEEAADAVKSSEKSMFGQDFDDLTPEEQHRRACEKLDEMFEGDEPVDDPEEN